MAPTINPKLAWKLVSSRYLIQDPWFTVREECLDLPNGKRIPNYHVLEYPDWVIVIALTPDDKMVLVQQYRHGIGKVSFELTAGVCEKTDPSYLETARRELLEETGYGGGEWSLFTVLSANPATHSNLSSTYLARNVTKVASPSLDEGEVLSAHLFEKKEVLELLRRDEICQALMAAALWKYFCEFGTGG